MNSLLQLRLERRVDDPLANLRPGFRQRRDVVNVGFIQQLIDTLVDSALVEKQIESISRGGKTVGYGNARGRTD